MKTLQIHAAVKIRCGTGGGRDNFEKEEKEKEEEYNSEDSNESQDFQGAEQATQRGKVSWIFFVTGEKGRMQEDELRWVQRSSGSNSSPQSQDDSFDRKELWMGD